MRNKRDAASISKLDLDSFVFTPPGSMGWQSHESETGSEDDASEERFSMAGRLKEFPSAGAPPHSGKKKSSKKSGNQASEPHQKGSAPPRKEKKRKAPKNKSRDKRTVVTHLPGKGIVSPWISSIVKGER
ncbi:hypothetical protein GXP75_20475 [Bacillus sp. HU-1818]|uniref:hypothetical protein n=1 Tax=Bacillus sp. HU-1818 TaxID=2704469 RepID=UPI001F5D55EE|nr:hypothetical protein [Bacillus sp. HU-1818]MCI3197996.1 hypothetical protein [Bacillus sp. HU-1818]